MLDDDVVLKIRQSDEGIINSCIDDAKKDYNEGTKKDVNVAVDKDNYLPDQSLGGIIITKQNGNLSVDNTIEARIRLIADSDDSALLPQYRYVLFGSNPNRKHLD